MINTYDFCKSSLRFTDDEINKNEKISRQEMDKNKILKYLKDTYKPGTIFIDLVNNVKFEVDNNAIINDYSNQYKHYFYISVKPKIGYTNKTARVFELIDNKEVYAEIVKFKAHFDLSLIQNPLMPIATKSALATIQETEVQSLQMIGRQKRDSNTVINIIDISQLNTIYHIKMLSTIKIPLLSNKINKQNNLNNIKIINKK